MRKIFQTFNHPCYHIWLNDNSTNFFPLSPSIILDRKISPIKISIQFRIILVNYFILDEKIISKQKGRNLRDLIFHLFINYY